MGRWNEAVLGDKKEGTAGVESLLRVKLNKPSKFLSNVSERVFGRKLKVSSKEWEDSDIGRSFIFAKNVIVKLLPYAAHLVIILIFFFVVLNNIAGRQDQARGEEREGSSILFTGVLDGSDRSLVENQNKEGSLVGGVGGFSQDISNTVLAAADNSGDPQDDNPDLGLATVGGSALIPLAILEQEVQAGPIEEERRGTVEHTVEAGESISLIAGRYGVSVRTILSANNLSEAAYIRPGDKLKIPPVSGVVYTVKKGDTLGEIAQVYQGEMSKIMEYNNLQSENDLQIGQTLLIPGGKIPTPIARPQYSEYAEGAPSEEDNAPSTGRGGWLWPTISHKINQYFSYRHKGVDIDGNVGSPIYVARAGTIVFAGWRGGYGKCVIVNHFDGSQTLYGHLAGYKRTVGDVSTGELIGYVGSTGWSTGPHLHFELRTARGSANPLNYIR